MFTVFFRAVAALVLSVSVAYAATHDMSSHQHHEAAATATAEIYHAQGRVKKVAADSLSIAHHPIPELNWPAMTMTFLAPAEGGLPLLKPGDAIDFTFSQQADGYRLVAVTPAK